MQKCKIPKILAQLLTMRGISFDEADNFLKPKLRNLMPDPFHLHDMEIAVQRLMSAVENSQKIAIFGDYDVDGATSSALLYQYLVAIGCENVVIYIPDRIDEGYGPNSAAFQKLKEQGIELCITVDCGTVAYEPLREAKEMGLDLIVIDHHIGGDVLPEAIAVINPNRLDETSEYTYLCAVGVCFLFIAATNSVLRDNRDDIPDLTQYLDLVALGTVCDLMPLIGLNRAFVAQGLKILQRYGNIGIKMLSETMGLNEAPSAYHLGYGFGPRINAGGRIGEASLGAKLLSSNDEQFARKISDKLDTLNQERKTLETIAVEEAISQITAEDSLIMITGDWHPGIIGLIASRIKERFDLPTAVLSIQNGIAKASARSVSEIDFGAAVLEARCLDLVIEGGGHKMAAGFSVHEKDISQLREFFITRFKDKLQNRIRKRYVELDLHIQAINITTFNIIQFAEPFGIGNQSPRIIVHNVYIHKIKILKEAHIMFFITDSNISIKVISFRSIGTELERKIMSAEGCKMSIVGSLSLNAWNGKESVEIILEDMFKQQH